MHKRLPSNSDMKLITHCQMGSWGGTACRMSRQPVVSYTVLTFVQRLTNSCIQLYTKIACCCYAYFEQWQRLHRQHIMYGTFLQVLSCCVMQAVAVHPLYFKFTSPDLIQAASPCTSSYSWAECRSVCGAVVPKQFSEQSPQAQWVVAVHWAFVMDC